MCECEGVAGGGGLALADLQQTTPGLLFLGTINTSLYLRDIV